MNAAEKSRPESPLGGPEIPPRMTGKTDTADKRSKHTAGASNTSIG